MILGPGGWQTGGAVGGLTGLGAPPQHYYIQAVITIRAVYWRLGCELRLKRTSPTVSLPSWSLVLPLHDLVSLVCSPER